MTVATPEVALRERIAALEARATAADDRFTTIRADIARIEHRLYLVVATGIVGGQAITLGATQFLGGSP